MPTSTHPPHLPHQLGVAQKQSARVTQHCVFGSICQGAILLQTFELPAGKGPSPFSPCPPAFRSILGVDVRPKRDASPRHLGPRPLVKRSLPPRVASSGPRPLVFRDRSHKSEVAPKPKWELPVLGVNFEVGTSVFRGFCCQSGNQRVAGVKNVRLECACATRCLLETPIWRYGALTHRGAGGHAI